MVDLKLVFPRKLLSDIDMHYKYIKLSDAACQMAGLKN